jgi:hypothetical protein
MSDFAQDEAARVGLVTDWRCSRLHLPVGFILSEVEG